MKSFLNNVSVYLISSLCCVFQLYKYTVRVWIPQHWLMNKLLVLSYKPSKSNKFLCRKIHNIKLHVDFVFHVSFLISGPPFIAHPASETDISGWIFEADINFLLGKFYPWCVLLLKQQEKCRIFMHPVVLFGIAIRSTFLFDTLRFICFLTCEIVETMKYMCLANWKSNLPI